MKQADVVIIGGGFVGLTAALVLARQGLSVNILDAKSNQNPKADGRAIALAYTSVVLLHNLQVLSYIQDVLNPIDEVITSEEGRFNKLRIKAKDLSLPYLGQICPAPRLGQGLRQACLDRPGIMMTEGAKVIRIDTPQRAVVYEENGIEETFRAQLILCCDGADSSLAKSLGYKASVKSYDQHAWVANISCTSSHHNTAIERFTQWGTLALLPLKGQRMTVVLTLNHEKHEAWQLLSEDEKLQALQTAIGTRFGNLFELGETFEYPLMETVLDQSFQAGLLFLGNAVHTLNPIAAQGLNLSLRDISVFSDVIKDTLALSQDIGGIACLASYDAKVRPAHQSMLRLTDFLVFIAKNNFTYARSLALGLLNTTLAKGLLAKTLAGLSSHRGSLMERMYDL